MAGHETASEGFAPGQTGSSAMPHKMNSRSCERVNGFHVILKGYLAMAAGLAGDQWNEGDVSCSVVRRVMLPDSFFAIDGMFETFLTVLDQMDAYEAVIDAETAHYLPFLMTTTIMMEAVKAGVGRETAHKAIKEHAVATVNDLRHGKIDRNNLVERLAGHPPRSFPRFPRRHPRQRRSGIRCREIADRRLRRSGEKTRSRPSGCRRLRAGFDSMRHAEIRLLFKMRCKGRTSFLNQHSSISPALGFS